MKNKTAKQILSAYRAKCIAIGVVYALALAALCFVMTINTLIGILGIIVLAASIKAPFDKIREKDLESVLYDELDPVKFRELIELGAMKKSNRLQVVAAMSLGEYDNVIALVDENAKTDNPIEKCNNLYRKAHVYFEQKDYEKLAVVVKEFYTLKAQFPKFQQVFNNYTVFDKFDAFLDDDFEYVIDVCDLDLKQLVTKHQNYKITKINVSFYRAVSLYKLGQLEEAKAGFEWIIEYAPKMHKAKLSREYLDLINM